MNAEGLLAHYERIADTPDAIARLRRFVLDLAVRGKLAPQDPKDESASELLNRIEKEKARLVKAGKIRNPKPISALSETPFPAPTGWRWSQIAEIGVLSPRNEAHDTRATSFVPMPLIAAEYGIANGHEIRPWGEIKRGYTHFAEGDVGLAKITPCFENGKSTIFRNLRGGIGSGTTELHIVRPLFVDPNFILLFLKCPYFIETGIPKMTGTAGQKRVPIEYFANSPFPLPPLAEQHRIVAKVDELMALCDRIEATRTEREATRDKLTAVSFARLNAPDPEAFHEDARFVLDALPALTTRRDQIKQFRQTILNLAVRGKLVPQDPNDEPASELLKRIREWQQNAISKKQIRAPRKPLKSIKPEERPYHRPKGWAWARLGEIIYIQSGDGLTSANMKNGDIPVFGGNGINGHHDQSNVNQQTVVIGRVGYYCGSIHVTPPKAWVTDNAFITHFSQNDIYLMFLVLLLNGTNLKENENATAQPVISGSKIYPIVVGLPPLAEQHRIVAKVDQLMALCGRLEASLATGEDVRRRLLDALLAEALEPVEGDLEQAA
jgi:type I restriction enzyme S subunit